MKRNELKAIEGPLATRVIALTIVLAIGSTLVFVPSASAKENGLFDIVRNLLGGRQVQPQQQQAPGNTDNIQAIIRSGDQQITHMLQSLARLQAKINASVKLSNADKAALNGHVNLLITELNALKAKLDAETSVVAAQAYLQKLRTDFRSYNQIMPKVHLLKLADDILMTDAKLSALALKLQARISAAKDAGKNVTALDAKLTDLTSRVASSEAIANSVKNSVLKLPNSGGNSGAFHPYNAQLKSARQDVHAAYADARSIVDALKQGVQ